MKNLSFLQKSFFKFLIFISFLVQSQNSFGQACEQLEILFTPEACFKEQSTGMAPTDPSNVCKNTTVCIDTPSKFGSSITGGMGYTYLWTATGPSAVVFAPNNMSPVVNIVWTQLGTYRLDLTVNDGMGNIYTTCLTVKVEEKPVANFTFSNNNDCAGSTVSFTNTSTNSNGGMVYSWNFGDPSSGTNNYDNTTNPTHIFNAPGNYTVCLIASSFVTETIITVVQGKEVRETLNKVCCSDTICKQVRVAPGTLKIDCISTVCAGTTQTYTSVGCANTAWATPVGGTITASTPTSVTIQWGNGAVQGQIIASCTPGGCTTTVPVPIIPANPVPVGNVKPCVNSTTSYTLPLLPGTYYTWALENVTQGITYTTSPYIYTYPDNNTVWVNWAFVGSYPDVYKLKIKLNNNHICCASEGFLNITPKETFEAKVVDPVICLGSSGVFNAFTGFSPSTYGLFNWSTTPTAGVVLPTGTGFGYSPVFNNPGDYIITLTEAASYCNTSAQVNIKVLPATPAPGSILGPTTICLGSTNSYSMSTPAPSGYHYKWTIAGAGNVFMPGAVTPDVFGDNVNIQWATLSGGVFVVLERDSAPACPSSTVTLTVTSAITGTISGPNNVCVDGTQSYTLSGSTIPTSETVTWSIAAPNQALGTITSGQGTNSVNILWHGDLPAVGPWGPVTINATSACGAAVALTGVMIYPKFVFTLQKDNVDICQPAGTTLSVTPTAPANIASYLWSNGGVAPTTSVTAPGTYSLTITNVGGCFFTKTIDVFDPLLITTQCTVGVCTGPGTFKEDLSVSATAPIPGSISYQWYQGATPVGLNLPNYSATVAGPYSVVVTYGTGVGVGVCTKTLTFNVVQVCCIDLNRPEITNVVQNTCFEFTFTGTTLNTNTANYHWDFGDGNTQDGTLNPTHTYANAGIYCVKFCIDGPTGCGVNCDLTSVIVPIKANFYTNLRCNGCVDVINTSVNLAPSFVTSTWDFGDGSPVFVGSNPPQHCYPAVGGTFILKLTMTYTNGPVTCQSIYSQSITHIPLAVNVTPNPVCTNSTTNFSFTGNPGPYNSYTWAFGDGFNAFSAATTHIYTTSGTFPMAGLRLVDIYGTTCLFPFSVTVLPGNPCIILPKYLCPNSTATLNGPAGGTAYAWEEFNGSIWIPAAGINNGVNYSTAVVGTFRVIVTGSNGCICVSNAVNVLAVPKPDAQILVSPSKKLCVPSPGSFVTLTSTNHLPGYTSAWYYTSSAGVLINANSATITDSPTMSTTYVLVLTNEYGCSDECSIFVEVNPQPSVPVITSNPMGVLCEGQSIILTSSYANNNSWNTGELTQAINVFNSGVYTVTYTNPITGCSSSATKVVHSRPSADLFPHFCDLISCTCDLYSPRPFAIYAPRPLIGPFAVAYNFAWFNSPSNTQILPPSLFSAGGTVFHNLPIDPVNGVPTGTYYITMTDPVTGCSTKSETYAVTVPVCADCDCTGSSWESITMSTPSPFGRLSAAAPIVTNIACDKTYDVSCNVPITINSTFLCSDPLCPSTVAYTLIPPTGPSILGNLPLTFTPTGSGTVTYTLVLNAYCNGILCKSCVIKFTATCGPLDVNLLNFEGKKIEKMIELKWTTTSETNNDYFLLEKANENGQFEKLGNIKGKENSKENTNYSFNDTNPINGVNYYKLKAIDITGKITNSKIIGVAFSEIMQPRLYPNPTNLSIVTFDISLDYNSNLTLEWFDMLGRVLKTSKLKGNKGQNKFELNTSDLPTGKYLIRVIQDNNLNLISNILSFEKL